MVRVRSRSKTINPKKSDEETVILLKPVERSIDWEALTEDERYNIFLRELGEKVYQYPNFTQHLRDVSDLFTQYNILQEYQKILNGTASDTAIVREFLVHSQFVPILDDIKLIFEGTSVKNKQMTKQIKLKEFYEKLANLNSLQGNVADTIKEYENVISKGDIILRSDVTRFGSRLVNFSINKPLDISRTITADETISVKGFSISFPSKRNIFSNWQKSLNRTRLFAPEFKRPTFAKAKPFTSFSPSKLTNWLTYLKDVNKLNKYISIPYSNKLIDDLNERHDRVNQIGQIVPSAQVQLRENIVPDWILQFDALKSIYGPYYSWNTLSDNVIQRELWGKRSWVSSLPIHYIKHAQEVLGVDCPKNFSVLTDKSLERKLGSLISLTETPKALQRKIAEMCDSKASPSANAETINFLTQFNELVSQITTRNRINQKISQINEVIRLLALRQSIYIQSISEQLGPVRLDELLNQSRSKWVLISTLLTKNEQNLISKFISHEQKLKLERAKNNCPHFILRAQYDTTIDLDEKYKIFSKLYQNFSTPKLFDQETRIVTCTNCGFPLCCQHEVYLYKMYTDVPRREEYLKILEDQYYGPVTQGYIINCKYCGRKLDEANIEQELSFDENGFKISGYIIKKDSQQDITLRSLAREVLVHTSLQGKVNYYKLADAVSDNVMTNWDKVEKQGYSSEETQVLKKLHGYAWIYAQIMHAIMTNKLTLRKKYPVNLTSSDEDKRKTILKHFLSINRDRNSEWFQIMQSYGFVNLFTKTLYTAYKTIRDNELKLAEGISNFSVAQKIWGYRFSPLDFYFTPGKPYKTKPIDKLKVPEKLFVAFKNRWYPRATELVTVPFNDVKWKENNDMYDNKELNKEYVLYTNFGLPCNFNRRRVPEVKLPPIKLNPNDEWNLVNYDEDGIPRNYPFVSLTAPKLGTTKLNASKIKTDLKQQKELFNQGYNIITDTPDFYKINNNTLITAESINMFSRTKLTKANKSPKDFKNKSYNTNKIRTKYFEYLRHTQVNDILSSLCAGSLGQRYFWAGIEIFCDNTPHSDTLASKIIHALDSNEKRAHKPSDIKPLDVHKVTVSSSELGQTVLNINTVIDFVNKLRPKDTEKYIDFISNLGTLPKVNEIQLAKARDDKIETRRVRREQKNSQMMFIKDALRAAQEAYLTSNKYSNPLPKDFNIFTYTKILNASDTKASNKIYSLINYYIKLLTFLIKSVDRAFALDQINKQMEKTKLLDATPSELNSLDIQLDTERRRRTERFLKMTPEEKFAQGFQELDLEQQIELLREQDETAQATSYLNDEEDAPQVNPEHQEDVFARTADDEQSMDDDIALYQTDSFEVY